MILKYLQFTIYYIQIILANMKIIIGDDKAFTIYRLILPTGK